MMLFLDNNNQKDSADNINSVTDLIEKSQRISDSWLEKGLPNKPEDKSDTSKSKDKNK